MMMHIYLWNTVKAIADSYRNGQGKPQVVFIGEERQTVWLLLFGKQRREIYGAFRGYVQKQHENNGPHIQKICDVQSMT